MTQPALFDAAAKPADDGPMPAWLIRALEEKTGGFRAARWTRCPRCQDITLQGLDADICAFTVTVDPTPLTATTELACLLAGRKTYWAELQEGKITLDYRDRHRMKTPPGKGLIPNVIPAHHCGARVPGFLKPPTPKGRTTPNECPF